MFEEERGSCSLPVLYLSRDLFPGSAASLRRVSYAEVILNLLLLLSSDFSIFMLYFLPIWRPSLARMGAGNSEAAH